MSEIAKMLFAGSKRSPVGFFIVESGLENTIRIFLFLLIGLFENIVYANSSSFIEFADINCDSNKVPLSWSKISTRVSFRSFARRRSTRIAPKPTVSFVVVIVSSAVWDEKRGLWVEYVSSPYETIWFWDAGRNAAIAIRIMLPIIICGI